MVTANTRKTSILDYCLISRKIYTNYTCKIDPPLANSDHNCISIHKKTPTKAAFTTKTLLDLRASNVDTFINSISTANWSNIFYSLNVDDQVEHFNKIIHEYLAEIPTYTIKTSENDKKWITPICKHLINLRWRAFRQKNFDLYNHYKDKVKDEIRKSKVMWVEKCKKKNPDVWKIVKNSTGKSSKNIDALKWNEETKKEFANRLNVELSTSFNKNLFGALPNIEHLPCTYSIDEINVFESLSKINTHKAAGNDEIPNILLRKSALFISKPLCAIFNTILQTGKFPSLWKIADIIPIPKSTPPDITKLRPISLLPSCSKLFESHLLSLIKPFLLPHIHPDQHGFMPKSSTSICLLKIHDTLTKLLDQSFISAVSVISFDLRRAFDSIPHVLLLKKLYPLLPTSLFNLILNYVSLRYQQVKYEGVRSDRIAVISGVPQGTILSPLLFNVFINDLQFDPDSFLFKYADDTTILIPHYNMKSPTSETFADVINSKILAMKNWCDKNGLSLNIEKTQIMTIPKKRQLRNLHNPSSMKLLGVIFTSNLKWDEQISYLTKKAARNIYLIRKLKSFLSKKELQILYRSLIESILSYASALYINLPQHLHNKLEKISKRCHNIICYYGCKCNLINSPSSVRLKIGQKLFLKASDDPTHPLYNHLPKKMKFSGKYQQPASITDRRIKSFIPTMTHYINNLM